MSFILVPFIRAITIASGAFITYLLVPACDRCGSKFTNRRPCEICKSQICPNCGNDYEELKYKASTILKAGSRCCHEHATELQQLVTQACRKTDEVELARQRRKASEVINCHTKKPTHMKTKSQTTKHGKVKMSRYGYLRRKLRPTV